MKRIDNPEPPYSLEKERLLALDLEKLSKIPDKTINWVRSDYESTLHKIRYDITKHIVWNPISQRGISMKHIVNGFKILPLNKIKDLIATSGIDFSLKLRNIKRDYTYVKKNKYFEGKGTFRFLAPTLTYMFDFDLSYHTESTIQIPTHTSQITTPIIIIT